jgi:hypothetical protein
MDLYNKIMTWLIILITGVILGYAWKLAQEKNLELTCIDTKILEASIRTGLKNKLPFFVENTNIHIVPRKDGTGVVRIKD